MNLLIVGMGEKELPTLTEPFLLIDDEPEPELPDGKVSFLDLSKDSFNPLLGIDYRRAIEFLSVINAIFPQGENTLTRGQSDDVFLTALLSGKTRLDKLVRKTKDPGELEAYRKIHRLLLSPVLYNFLCNPAHHTNFSLKGTVIARLNRAELGDFDCFVIGNLLISAYPGQVVIPDFGFYGCAFHSALVRQERLIAGVNFLDEAKDLRNNLLLIKDKVGQGCIFEDAETLARHARLMPDTVAFSDFVYKSMGD